MPIQKIAFVGLLTAATVVVDIDKLAPTTMSTLTWPKISCKYKPTDLSKCYKILYPCQGKASLVLSVRFPNEQFDPEHQISPQCHHLFHITRWPMWHPWLIHDAMSSVMISQEDPRNDIHFGNQTKGPEHSGLEHGLCMNSSEDFPHRVLESSSEDRTNYLEKLVVEYASNVELQTLYTRTTQETSDLYLANQCIPKVFKFK